MKVKAFFLVWLCFFSALGIVTADDAADYRHAIDQALIHAADPDGWTVNDLKVITGPNSGDGNIYVGNRAIVRTFTKESYYTTDYAGKDKTAYGDPATNAMWVTTGDELKEFYADNNATAENVHRLTSISTGMNSTNTNNIIAEFLLEPDNNHILRPVKDPDIATQPIAFGAGYRFRDRSSLGLMGGYMNSHIDYTDHSGKNEITTLRVGPYAKYDIDDLLLYAAFTFGYHRVDNTRNIAFNTISRTALSDYNMYDLMPYAGVEYNWRLRDRLTLTPLASIQYAFLHQDSYRESGATAASLDVESVDAHSLITSLGAILGYRIDHKVMTLLPEIWANWRHGFLDQGEDIVTSFLGTPDSSFITELDEPYRDRANLGTGITLFINNNASAFLKYNGLFQTRGDFHVLSLGVMVNF